MQCKDVEDLERCKKVKTNGNCEKHPEWANKNCKKTCELCPGLGS